MLVINSKNKNLLLNNKLANEKWLFFEIKSNHRKNTPDICV